MIHITVIPNLSVTPRVPPLIHWCTSVFKIPAFSVTEVQISSLGIALEHPRTASCSEAIHWKRKVVMQHSHATLYSRCGITGTFMKRFACFIYTLWRLMHRVLFANVLLVWAHCVIHEHAEDTLPSQPYHCTRWAIPADPQQHVCDAAQRTKLVSVPVSLSFYLSIIRAAARARGPGILWDASIISVLLCVVCKWWTGPEMQGCLEGVCSIVSASGSDFCSSESTINTQQLDLVAESQVWSMQQPVCATEWLICHKFGFHTFLHNVIQHTHMWFHLLWLPYFDVHVSV